MARYRMPRTTARHQSLRAAETWVEKVLRFHRKSSDQLRAQQLGEDSWGYKLNAYHFVTDAGSNSTLPLVLSMMT